jgi:predicted nuclease of predicted toxin-antitoxin system
MKLLLDANLSWRMAIILKQYFDECIHVDKCNLPVPAKDIEIWNHAKENDFIIVTMDEDFIDFLNVKGFPPNNFIKNR